MLIIDAWFWCLNEQHNEWQSVSSVGIQSVHPVCAFRHLAAPARSVVVEVECVRNLPREREGTANSKLNHLKRKFKSIFNQFGPFRNLNLQEAHFLQSRGHSKLRRLVLAGSAARANVLAMLRTDKMLIRLCRRHRSGESLSYEHLKCHTVWLTHFQMNHLKWWDSSEP